MIAIKSNGCKLLQSASARFIASYCKMMQNKFMRTSVTLDQDVYELAMVCARGRGITLGAAIGELVRKGLEAREKESESLSPNLMKLPNGMIVARSQGRVLTSEMVKAALDEVGY